MGTETETPTGTTAQAHIAGDAPFVYLPDTVFKEIYDAPTLLTYGFNVEEALQPQMEEFLSSYVSENTSVAYTSTKLLKEQLDSCLLYTSPSPRDLSTSRMPSSA